jgi:predicted S18 family serine protease
MSSKKTETKKTEATVNVVDVITKSKKALADARAVYKNLLATMSPGDNAEVVSKKARLKELNVAKNDIMVGLKPILKELREVKQHLKEQRADSSNSELKEAKIALLEAELGYRKACIG